jgi:hypothetical protein
MPCFCRTRKLTISSGPGASPDRSGPQLHSFCTIYHSGLRSDFFAWTFQFKRCTHATPNKNFLKLWLCTWSLLTPEGFKHFSCPFLKYPLFTELRGRVQHNPDKNPTKENFWRYEKKSENRAVSTGQWPTAASVQNNGQKEVRTE